MKKQRAEPGSKILPRLEIVAFALLVFQVGASVACAQETLSGAESPTTVTAPMIAARPELLKANIHRFWDKKNDWLFASVGAARTFDYFSTLNLRRRGDQEVLLTNAIVDNHAAFSAIEAAGTATSIGVSYLFHRYGHHKLERWTSIVHFGLTSDGAVRNYCLKTAHPKTTP